MNAWQTIGLEIWPNTFVEEIVHFGADEHCIATLTNGYKVTIPTKGLSVEVIRRFATPTIKINEQLDQNKTMKINRYEINVHYGTMQSMNGDWVKYKDVKDLIEKAEKPEPNLWKPINTIPDDYACEVLYFDGMAQQYVITCAKKVYGRIGEGVCGSGAWITPTHWRRIV